MSEPAWLASLTEPRETAASNRGGVRHHCCPASCSTHLRCIYTVVSYDLRSPSMLHGKKGFDRLVYASRKVLNQPLTWLFCNIAESSNSLALLLLERISDEE